MKPRTIIGVGGGTGSGKTTFCRKLAEFLGPEQVLTLSQDFDTVRPMHLRFVEPARRQADRVISGVEGIEQQVAEVGKRIRGAAGICREGGRPGS